MPPQLTIQIVGWNSAKTLPATLAALKNIPPDEVIIRYLDNASQDDSISLVRQNLPQADIISLPANRGFAGAHNLGFSQCTTPYVLTCDPDMQLDWEGIKQLLAFLNDPKIAAVQGKVLRPDGKIDSTGIKLSLALNGLERGANEEDRGQYDAEAAIIAVTGAAGLYRLKALQQVAHTPPVEGVSEVFDKDFFAYKEDVDLGWRLNKAGYKVLYVPIPMGTHARTLGRRGVFNWGLNPKETYNRLRSPRTRYSFRNWLWMITKNVTLKQELVSEIFILSRLFAFFLLNLAYPPFFKVWLETIQGIPKMLDKRTKSD